MMFLELGMRRPLFYDGVLISLFRQLRFSERSRFAASRLIAAVPNLKRAGAAFSSSRALLLRRAPEASFRRGAPRVKAAVTSASAGAAVPSLKPSSLR